MDQYAALVLGHGNRGAAGLLGGRGRAAVDPRARGAALGSLHSAASHRTAQPRSAWHFSVDHVWIALSPTRQCDRTLGLRGAADGGREQDPGEHLHGADAGALRRGPRAAPLHRDSRPRTLVQGLAL